MLMVRRTKKNACGRYDKVLPYDRPGSNSWDYTVERKRCPFCGQVTKDSRVTCSCAGRSTRTTLGRPTRFISREKMVNRDNMLWTCFVSQMLDDFIRLIRRQKTTHTVRGASCPRPPNGRRPHVRAFGNVAVAPGAAHDVRFDQPAALACCLSQPPYSPQALPYPSLHLVSVFPPKALL